jgi:hypothetical protein
MHVTAPGGASTALDARSGVTATWSFPASADGGYTVAGTIDAKNGSAAVPIASHFTIWVPPTTTTPTSPPPPPVQATAAPTTSGAVTTSDGKATIAWQPGAFSSSQPVVVDVAPLAPSQVQNLPANTVVVNVSASVLGSNAALHTLSGVIEIRFPNTRADLVPLVSTDGKIWSSMPSLSSAALPDGQPDGYFREGTTLRIFTRHLTYFALTPRANAPHRAITLKAVGPTRIWTTGRTYVGIHLELSTPARVTSWWLDSSGTIVPNSTHRTRTLPRGSTNLRLPLPQQLTPGYYRIQLRASGGAALAKPSVGIRVLQTQPPGPTAPGTKPVTVVLLPGIGVRNIDQLGRTLGSGFKVAPTSAATIYSAVNPRFAPYAVLVLDLDRTPLPLITALHAVYPELQIIGLASDQLTADLGRRAGTSLVVSKPISLDTLTRLIRTVARPGP